MRAIRDPILRKVVEKLETSTRNGCRAFYVDNLDSQLRDMPQLADLSSDERYDLLKRKLLPARKIAQEEGLPVIRMWSSGARIGSFVNGLKVCDGSDIDKQLLDDDLLLDKGRAEGVIVAYEERREVARVAGVLTRGEVRRYQLFGGRGKRTKLIKK